MAFVILGAVALDSGRDVKSIEAVADVQTNLRFCPHVPTPPPIRLEVVISITPQNLNIFLGLFYVFLAVSATGKIAVRALIHSCLRVLYLCEWS